jgi:hypothetical protein
MLRVTRDKNERGFTHRMPRVYMATIVCARMSVDSVELTILLGARNRRRNRVNVCQLASKYRGTKLENDPNKEDRAPDSDPLRSVLRPFPYAFKQ